MTLEEFNAQSAKNWEELAINTERAFTDYKLAAGWISFLCFCAGMFIGILIGVARFS